MGGSGAKNRRKEKRQQQEEAAAGLPTTAAASVAGAGSGAKKKSTEKSSSSKDNRHTKEAGSPPPTGTSGASAAEVAAAVSKSSPNPQDKKQYWKDVEAKIQSKKNSFQKTKKGGATKPKAKPKKKFQKPKHLKRKLETAEDSSVKEQLQQELQSFQAQKEQLQTKGTTKKRKSSGSTTTMQTMNVGLVSLLLLVLVLMPTGTMGYANWLKCYVDLDDTEVVMNQKIKTHEKAPHIVELQVQRVDNLDNGNKVDPQGDWLLDDIKFPTSKATIWKVKVKPPEALQGSNMQYVIEGQGIYNDGSNGPEDGFVFTYPKMCDGRRSFGRNYNEA